MVSRNGCSYGLLEYKTDSIPTMGASNSGPHMEPIMRVEKMLEECTGKKSRKKIRMGGQIIIYF